MTVGIELDSGIYIISAGVTRLSEMTLEAHQIMKMSDVLVVLDAIPEVVAFAKATGVPVIDLWPIYEKHASNHDRYSLLADEILKCFNGQRVAFLTDGHPRFYNEISILLEQRCVRSNVPLYVTSGVSSIDKIISDLIADPGRSSFSCIPAGDLIEKRSVPCDVNIVLQPAGVCSDGSAFFSENVAADASEDLVVIVVELAERHNLKAVLYQAPHIAGRQASMMEICRDNILEASNSLNKATLVIAHEGHLIGYE